MAHISSSQQQYSRMTEFPKKVFNVVDHMQRRVAEAGLEYGLLAILKRRKIYCRTRHLTKLID